ncbi:hypothetical protein [Sedimentitalea sp. HM32M-2]|uniref:hypothetical protein n=1 Tax=Sedimentitalea sp. HM32M-2 TaxID=3351566 RepID=UPI0036D315AC
MHSVTVYGFGSAFATTDSAKKVANDVDLLIVHQNTGHASCKLAIDCKRLLVENISHAHVTMLSEGEEALLLFIKTANATPIGTVRADLFHSDLELLCKDLALIVGSEKVRRNDALESIGEAQSSKRPDAGIYSLGSTPN